MKDNKICHNCYATQDQRKQYSAFDGSNLKSPVKPDLKNDINHLILMNLSTLIIWTNQLSFLGLIIVRNFIEHFCGV